MILRTGRKLGRTLYLQLMDDPSDDDELLGLIMDPARAALIIQVVNGERPPLATPPDANPAEKLLDLGLPERPDDHDTVRSYLVALLASFWDGEGSAKYGMTGESDWRYDLYGPMVNAGLLPGASSFEHDGHGLDGGQQRTLDTLIFAAIRELH